MKVSSKTILGFLSIMLVAMVILGHQRSAIHQMQAVNRQLAEINVKSATTVLEMQKLAALLGEDSRKYFAGRDPIYDVQIAGFRNDFFEDLVRLRQTANSDREQAQLAKLREALDDYWLVFNRLKQQNKTWDPDELPPDLTLAVNHLEAQAEVMLDTIQITIKEHIAETTKISENAERISWIADLFSLLLNIIVAVLIVHSINQPLHQLTQKTHTITKKQF